MLKFLVDTYGQVYCLHMQRGAELHGPGEAFDQRDDWQPPEPAPKPVAGPALIALCGILLVTGLAFAI
jgi:hypothetical protein